MPCFPVQLGQNPEQSQRAHPGHYRDEQHHYVFRDIRGHARCLSFSQKVSHVLSPPGSLQLVLDCYQFAVRTAIQQWLVGGARRTPVTCGR